MSLPREQVVSIGGVGFWTAVQGKGQPIVLCHGGPGGYDYLKPVADMVDDVCQVLRYDQRGSGRSQVTRPYDVATFVNDLEGLRRHFNFERWIVGGHSWGAALALAYAVRFPVHTAGIVYLSGTGVDPAWHEGYHRNRLAALSDEEREEFQRLRVLRDRSVGEERDLVQRRLRALTQKTDVFDANLFGHLPTFDEYPTSDEVNRAVSEDWDIYADEPRFREAVCNLSIPALFIHGAGDPRPARFVEDLAAKLINGQFHLIPRAGHYPWIEALQAVRNLLRAFITEKCQY